MAVKVIDSLGRRWNPALHPRDSKGRFIETGGIARVWGSGLARIVRALDDKHVEIENAHGGRRVVPTAHVTMTQRPDGATPTSDKRKLRAEHERRIADPARGDGVGEPDRGTGGALPQPEPRTSRTLAPATIAKMSDDEIMDALNDSYRGVYDDATMDALAAELDQRDELPQDEFKPRGTDPEAGITVGGVEWPIALVEWAAKKPTNRGGWRGTGKTRTQLVAEAKEAYEHYVAMLDAALEPSIRQGDATTGPAVPSVINPKYRDNLPGRLQTAAADKWLRGGYTNQEYEKYASDEFKQWATQHEIMSETEWVNRWLAEHTGDRHTNTGAATTSKEWG